MTPVHIIHLKYVDSHLGLGCTSCRVCERVTNMWLLKLYSWSHLRNWDFFLYFSFSRIQRVTVVILPSLIRCRKLRWKAPPPHEEYLLCTSLKYHLVLGVDSHVRKPVHECIWRKLELISSVEPENERPRIPVLSTRRDFQLLLPWATALELLNCNVIGFTCKATTMNY